MIMKQMYILNENELRKFAEVFMRGMNPIAKNMIMRDLSANEVASALEAMFTNKIEGISLEQNGDQYIFSMVSNTSENDTNIILSSIANAFKQPDSAE